MEVNDALIAILKKSHAQAMEGQAVSMDEVEHYMDTRIYEPYKSCGRPLRCRAFLRSLYIHIQRSENVNCVNSPARFIK